MSNWTDFDYDTAPMVISEAAMQIMLTANSVHLDSPLGRSVLNGYQALEADGNWFAVAVEEQPQTPPNAPTRHGTGSLLDASADAYCGTTTVPGSRAARTAQPQGPTLLDTVADLWCGKETA